MGLHRHELPPLIGRRSEFDSLVGALQRAAAGEPQVSFIGGETGIGKSALLREFLRTAGDGGATVLVGATPVLLGAGIPFAPIAGALRELRSELTPDALDRAIPSGTELRRLLPGPEPITSAEAGPADQLRLFEQFLALLHQLGAVGGPVLMAIEDLHWVDTSTLDLLAYVVRNLSTGRVLFLGTYRSTDLVLTAPLHRLLVESARQRPVLHLELSGLESAELEAIAAGAAPELDSDAAKTIGERAGGNPLFAEELARYGGDRLPPTLVTLLEERTSRISSEGQRLIKLAAVAGSTAPAAVIDAACAALRLDLSTAFSEVRQAGVLEVRASAGGETYAFRHLLFQEVAYAQMVSAERRQLHGVIAEALEPILPTAVGEPSLAIAAAHHWWTAGDMDHALPSLLNAGRLAEGYFAFAEAHALYELALVAREQSSPTPAPTSRNPIGFGQRPREVFIRGDLLERTARCASLAGRPERAAELTGLARALSADSDPRLLSQHGTYLWEAGHRREGLVMLDTAASEVARADPGRRAPVLVAAARGHLLIGDFGQAAQLAERAVTEAKTSGNDGDEVQALFLQAAACAQAGRIPEAVLVLEEARTADQRRRHRTRIQPRPSRIVDLLAGYWSEAMVLGRSGESAESLTVAREGLEQARRAGVSHGWGGLIGVVAVDELIDLGRWGEAGELVDELLAGRPDPANAAELHAARSVLLTRSGSITDSISEIAAARATGGELLGTSTKWRVSRAAAELALWTGQLDEAARVLDESLAIGPTHADSRLYADLLWLRMWACAEAVAIARARRGEPGRLEAEERAATLSGQLLTLQESADTSPKIRAVIDTAEAESARALGRDASMAFEKAAGDWHALREPFNAAYCEWRLAEALVASRGPRDQPRRAVASALAACEDLGAEPLRRELAALARRARLEAKAVSPMTPPSTEGNAPTDQLQLSPREMEVLTLLTEGRTNRQIGERLFITEKTAGHHVSSILGKLGVSSRVEAAAMAARLGVAAPPDQSS